MPLLSVTTGKRGTTEGVATQVVQGTLTISPGFVIAFDPSVFTVPGRYTLFSYANLSGDPTKLVADTATMALCGFSNATFSTSGTTVNGYVYVTLS